MIHSPRTGHRKRPALWGALTLLGLSAATTLLTWLPGPQLVHFGAAFALLWLLPAAGWAAALGGDWGERSAFGSGVAFVLGGLATLLLCLLPGAFPVGVARLVYFLLAAVPAAVAMKGGTAQSPALKQSLSIAAVLAILVIAGPARIVNLGYSEFQGDEAVIMQRAALMLAGDDNQLFLHQKGPVEILAPLSLWALTGTVNEWQARLPFSLAGLLAVIAVALLAARWFGSRAGAPAGLLVAICGFLVAFGRIVQYQNFVVAMGALGLLALAAYASQGRLRDLVLGAAFIAYGLLAHYDAVLVGPAALWLLGAGVWSRRAAWRREARNAGLAAGVGIAILAIFYLPFVTNPMFNRTFTYLSAGRLGSGGLFHNSAQSVWVMSTFYNAGYYAVGLLALIGIGVLGRVRKVEAWLYFAVPFLFYTLVVIDPRTHVYTFYPGAAIIAGWVLAQLWEGAWPERRRLALVGAVGAAMWYVLCAAYIGLAFVGHRPEYKREWPASRHSLYPPGQATWPLYGNFGFPYRAGWKAVEMLFARGVLQGTYASNEEPEVTTWYVRSGARTMCDGPDHYIVAVNVQDEVEIDRGELERDYSLAFQITVEGRSKISIYRRGSSPEEVVTVPVEAWGAEFDRRTTPAAQSPDPRGGEYAVGADFDGIGRLLGYDLSARRVRRGESLVVTLYWHALSSPQRNYQVFTHLMSGTELAAQHDGAPACAHAPTSLWEAGEIVRDEHTILVGEEMPLGTLKLYVGMYDLLTLTPLTVEGTTDEAVFLQEVDVLPGERSLRLAQRSRGR